MSHTTRHRHTLEDVRRQVLNPVGYGRWSHYTVTFEMVDGCNGKAPAVNTIHQAMTRALDWFPQAETVVRES